MEPSSFGSDLAPHHSPSSKLYDLGAYSERVRNIDQQVWVAEVTMGVGLSACTVPAAGRPGFELGDRESKSASAFTARPALARTPLQAADRLVDLMLERTIADKEILPRERVALHSRPARIGLPGRKGH